MLLGTVLLASIMPVRGSLAPVFDAVTTAGIILLFFLHGAKLPRQAIIDGARNWRLHLVTLSVTFLVFPVLGLSLSSLPMLSAPVAAGLLFLTLLPSTVQSSIAFTAVARGNVAAAVCSAAFSNLGGIILTPLLVALLMPSRGGGGALSLDSILQIAFQLLVPFILGHLLRPVVGPFVARHKTLVMSVDRGSILLVVFTAFSAAVVEGLWRHVSLTMLAAIAGLSSLLLAVVMLISHALARVMGLPREDAIVLLFCGSKKSLASGVPMAGVLFPAAQVGGVILPLMIFHQIQLICCAFIAGRYAKANATSTPAVAASGHQDSAES
jgi:sodium/bile acid cotransporter 7